MDNNEPLEKKTKRKLNFHRILPIALGCIILGVCIWGIIRLIIWNQGEEYIIDPNVNVDTETEDLVFFMSPAKTNPDYDGTLDILILGNDTVCYEDDEPSIADMLAEQINGNVYNCAFPGSYMGSQHPGDQLDEHPLDRFSFMWLSHSIMFQDYAEQRNCIEMLPEHIDKEAYSEAITLLESIDMNSIDLLLLYYDGHDYLAQNPLANPKDIYDSETIEGAFTGSYERYPINYPNMQHMLISPTFYYVYDEDGKREGCDIANLGEGNLPTCMTTLQIQAETYNVSYLDNFYGIDINAETADKYLLEDGITPNAEARKMIADRIAKYINIRL